MENKTFPGGKGLYFFWASCYTEKQCWTLEKYCCVLWLALKKRVSMISLEKEISLFLSSLLRGERWGESRRVQESHQKPCFWDFDLGILFLESQLNTGTWLYASDLQAVVWMCNTGHRFIEFIEFSIGDKLRTRNGVSIVLGYGFKLNSLMEILGGKWQSNFA